MSNYGYYVSIKRNLILQFDDPFSDCGLTNALLANPVEYP